MVPEFGWFLLGGMVFGLVAGFLALLLPFRVLCRKAGFRLSWAWLAAISLLVTQLMPLGLVAWAGLDAERRATVAAMRWPGYVAPIVFFALLWLFAWVRWPARGPAE